MKVLASVVVTAKMVGLVELHLPVPPFGPVHHILEILLQNVLIISLELVVPRILVSSASLNTELPIKVFE